MTTALIASPRPVWRRPPRRAGFGVRIQTGNQSPRRPGRVEGVEQSAFDAEKEGCDPHALQAQVDHTKLLCLLAADAIELGKSLGECLGPAVDLERRCFTLRLECPSALERGRPALRFRSLASLDIAALTLSPRE